MFDGIDFPDSYEIWIMAKKGKVTDVQFECCDP